MIALRNPVDDGGDNEGQLHVPARGACDFTTLCGSCWETDDDGELIKMIEVEIQSPKEITCYGCLQMLRAAKPYVSAINLRENQ